MLKLEKRKQLSITDIINQCKNGVDDNFCIYGSGNDLSEQDKYYIEDHPRIVNDEDVFPDFAIQNGLDLMYYGQQFMDVINNVLDQKPSATIHEFVIALNYYMDNDDFLDLNP